jgi:hypothetical protein
MKCQSPAPRSRGIYRLPPEIFIIIFEETAPYLQAKDEICENQLQRTRERGVCKWWKEMRVVSKDYFIASNTALDLLLQVLKNDRARGKEAEWLVIDCGPMEQWSDDSGLASVGELLGLMENLCDVSLLGVIDSSEVGLETLLWENLLNLKQMKEFEIKWPTPLSELHIIP